MFASLNIGKMITFDRFDWHEINQIMIVIPGFRPEMTVKSVFRPESGVSKP